MKYLFFIFIISCSATSNKPITKEELSSKSQLLLQENLPKFKKCSQYIEFKNSKEIEVHSNFRLNPEGRLETLWLDETVKWTPAFYDCLYNTIDQISFPSNESGISLEIEQPLVFKKL